MSPESYSWEVRETAEELYIIDGLTYEQVAQRTGVSISQLKRWGLDSTPSWTERRKEYRRAQISVRRGVMLAKARLIDSVIETEDPQKAYAFSALVSSAKTLEDEALARSGKAEAAPPDLPELTEPVDLASVLEQAINARAMMLLDQPGSLSLSAIKELQHEIS
ncbi:MAG: hypothetical protein CSA34_00435 [Desulfobulbus propionicus]|nr:MAG: hypothetical protein CSA34_00435 [Desulfobulbus propionicus]